MKTAIIASLAATATATHMLGEDANEIRRGDYEKRFVDWSLEHGIEFEDGEEFVQRLDIWIQADFTINSHNAAGHEWSMAHNEFSHLTWEEFRENRKIGEFSSGLPDYNATAVFKEGVTADSVDWSDAGAVTGVKDQGSCGSCWSFSTTGAIEGAYQIKNGELKSFSEQQLVECDTTDSGCNGGLMDYAFDWIKGNGGLCSEDDYPYTSGGGTAGTCQTTCSVVDGSAPTSYTDVDQTEDALAAAVTQQPVSIAIEADQSGFQYYSSGVYTGDCGTNLDHGVLLVGFGTDSGTDYWKVKNSWGTSWGANGYINLEKGKSQEGGQCGLLMAASYPTL